MDSAVGTLVRFWYRCPTGATEWRPWAAPRCTQWDPAVQPHHGAQLGPSVGISGKSDLRKCTQCKEWGNKRVWGTALQAAVRRRGGDAVDSGAEIPLQPLERWEWSRYFSEASGETPWEQISVLQPMEDPHGVAGGYSLKEPAASMLVQVLLAGTAAGREAHTERG